MSNLRVFGILFAVICGGAVAPASAQVQREYFQGMKKVCVYNTMRGERGIEVSRGERCPRTYRSQAIEDEVREEPQVKPVFGTFKRKLRDGNEILCVYSNGFGKDYVLRKPAGSICHITPY